jgi:hypothetical protein
MSHILGDPIVPGLYVNIGGKKCLSIQDIMGMSDTGRFLKNKDGDYINPFTRQPLNEGTINKINELLVLSGRETLSTLEFIPFEEFNYDGHRYYLYLLLLLEHKDLTISDQKKVIIKFSELLHSNFNSFYEQDKGKTWKIVNGKVVIMTPSGWLLPTDMLYKDWQNAGISLDELNEMIREEQERLSLRPRRLVFDFGKKRRRVLSKVTKSKRVSKAKKPKGSKKVTTRLRRTPGGTKRVSKTRKAPEESATLFEPWDIKRGNDGKLWMVTEYSNGTKRWTRY